MKQFYLLFAVVFFCTAIAHGQVIIASQDFEAVPATPTLTFTSTGPGNFTSGTSGNNANPTFANLFATGLRGWGSENSTSVITFANQVISPLLDGFIDFRIAGIGLTNGAGIDPGDVATVAVSVNNSSYSNELTLAGSANKQYWDFASPGYALITYDGDNSPTAFTSSIANGISRIIIKIPNTNTQVRLKITLNSSSNELWVIDDVRVGSATKYWDGNGATAGVGFSNTWGNTFTTDATGSSATVAATFIDDIRYQGTAGTVTLAASQNVSSHIMNVSGYQFATSGAGARTLDGIFTLNTNNIGFAPIAGSDLTLTGVISGNGAAGSVIFNKAGAGALVLSSANTFTGKLSIMQGIVEGANIDRFGAIPGSFTADQILLNGGGIRNTTASSIIVNNNRGLTLGAAGGTVEVNTGGDITLSTVVTGTGSLTKTGPGNMFFNANNTYTGNTIISAGTAILSAADRITNVSNMILNGGTFSTGATAGFNETVGTISVAANCTINIGTGSHSLNFSSAPAAFTGVLTISGWAGAINITGTSGKIFIGTSAILTVAQKNQIQFVGYALGNVAQLASGEIVPTGSQSPDYFRSNVVNGSWLVPLSWESSFDNLNWITAGLVPTSTAKTIEIRVGNSITVPGSITLDETLVNGTLEVQTGGILNIANGTGDDVSVSATGILRLAAGGATYGATVIPAPNATFNVASGGKITIGAGAAVGAGFETLATSTTLTTWQSGSIFEWNSTSTLTISNLTFFPNALANEIPIFRITTAPATVTGGTGTIINGIFEVNTNFILAGGSSKTFRNGLTGSGILTQNNTVGNRFIIGGSDAVLGGVSLSVVLSFNMYLRSDVTVPVSKIATISGADIDNTNLGAHALLVSGTLDVTDKQIINGGSSVTVNGLYRTAISGGFASGTFTNTSIPSGTVNVGAGSTIELYALGDQVLNARADFRNLIFSGSGTKTFSSGFDPTGTVTIKDAAIVDAGNQSFGNANTNLTMTGGRLRMAGTSPTAAKPDIDGTYLLTGGVIEFKGSNATRQTVKPKNAASADIVYNEIEITGTNVGQSNADIVLNSTSGKLTVVGALSPAANFYMSSYSIKSITIPPNNSLVSVQDGGNFFTSSSKGFSGFATSFTDNSSISLTIPAANISLASGSTVNYDRSSDQDISNQVPYHHLVISGTGNKTAASGTLTVQGNLVKTGTSIFLHNNSAVLLDGIANQNFAGLNYNILEMTNATKSLVGGASIRDSIKLNASTTLNIPASDSIVLLSTSSKTARVGIIPASANINAGAGKFVVERFILAGRKWRFLSIPTDDANQTFKSAWQEGAATALANPKPTYGFNIGDVVLQNATNGFDIKTLNGPVVKTHVSSSNTYIGIPIATGTNTKIKDLETARGNHLAYMAFVPGDRSIVAFNQSGSTTLRSSGKLYVGAQSVTIPPGPAPNFRGIGNPYASPINMIDVLNPAAFPGNGIASAYFIYDPRAAQLGAFITIFWDDFELKFKVAAPGSTAFPFNSEQNNLESGAGFFVQASSAGATINFKELSKGSSATQLNFTAGVPQRLYANLSRVSANGQSTVMDGLMARFDGSYSNNADNMDILKMTNTNETVGLFTSGKKMAVEHRAIITDKDTLHIHMSGLTVSNYKWDITADNLDYPGRTGFLIDRYLNTSTPLNMAGTTTVNFNVANIAGSYAADRFKIVFNQADAGPLPVTFTTVTATRKDNRSIDVNWKVENEINIISYEVERSADGSNFGSINSRAALVNNGGRASYLHNDLMALPADNFYRIKANSIGGQVQYSAIVKVSAVKQPNSISVYPNPVVDGNLQLRFIGQAFGNYQVQLSNAAGQVLYKTNVTVSSAVQSQLIPLPGNITSGSYQLRIVAADGGVSVLQVMVR